MTVQGLILSPLSPSISLKLVFPTLTPSVALQTHTEAQCRGGQAPLQVPHKLLPAPTHPLFHHQALSPTAAYFSLMLSTSATYKNFQGHFLSYQCLGPSPEALI